MDKSQIVRAWRDPEYFESLSAAERAQVPTNPAGLMEIDDATLDEVSGGEVCDPGPPYPDNYTCSGYTSICTPCPPRQCY